MLKRKRLEEALIELQKWCEKNSDYEKKWFLELYFHRVFEEQIEWGLGLSYGYSQDYISERHNFFSDTPLKAINKAKKNLYRLLKG